MKHSKEIRSFLDGLEQNSPQDIICEKRTLYCLDWYSRKATFYKRLYYIISIINIIAPLLSSFIIAFFDKEKIIVALLSNIASFCASLLSLFCAKDKWTNYRSATEFLKTQYILYLAYATPYNTSERHSIYLNTIEEYMTNIHSHWVKSQNNSSTQNGEPTNMNDVAT